MSVKASPGYDKAGFTATRTLLTSVRRAVGPHVPASLAGEPVSLSGAATAAPPKQSKDVKAGVLSSGISKALR